MNGTEPSELIPPIYMDAWASDKRYIVIKGGKMAGKSCFAALRLVYKVMNEGAEGLAVRARTRDCRSGLFYQLKWAASMLGSYNDWEFSHYPMRMTYHGNGHSIRLMGADDILHMEKGADQVWFEEATEINSYETFRDIVDNCADDVQVTVTFCPYTSDHWLRSVLWPMDGVHHLTVTSGDNTFLDTEDWKMLRDWTDRAEPEVRDVLYSGEWPPFEDMDLNEEYDAFDPDMYDRTLNNIARFDDTVTFGVGEGLSCIRCFNEEPQVFICMRNWCGVSRLPVCRKCAEELCKEDKKAWMEELECPQDSKDPSN